MISTFLKGPFVDGVSLQLLCFEVKSLMTREAQDVSSASGTTDGACRSSQVTCKRSLCHLQLSVSLTWLSQIPLWRFTELPTSYRKVRTCNAKQTQLWNALYIGLYINNFTDQFINQKLGSIQKFMIDTWNGLWQTHLSLDKKNFENPGPFATESLSNWILIHFLVKHVFLVPDFESIHVSWPLLLKPFSWIRTEEILLSTQFLQSPTLVHG